MRLHLVLMHMAVSCTIDAHGGILYRGNWFTVIKLTASTKPHVLDKTELKSRMCTLITASTAQRFEAAVRRQQRITDSQSQGYLLLVRSSMRKALRRSTKLGTCCSSQRAMLSHCRRERPAMPAGKAPSGCWAAPNRLSSRSRVSRVLKVLNTYRVSSSVEQQHWLKTTE